MKLLEQILNEMGAEGDKGFFLVPHFGVYLKCVKGITHYSKEKVVVKIGKDTLTIIGDDLTVGKYFMQDLLILGEVRGAQFE